MKGKQKTFEDFLMEMEEKHPDITVLGGFKDYNHTVQLECDICGHIWGSTPNSLINKGTGCPKCNKGGRPILDEEVFYGMARGNHGGSIIVGEFNGLNEPIKCTCVCCGHTWDPLARTLIGNNNGWKCPECHNDHGKKTNSRFLQELKEIHGDKITPLEEYKGSDVKIWCHCNICGHDWPVLPNSLINIKTGCPKCAFCGGSRMEEWLKEYMAQYDEQTYGPTRELFKSPITGRPLELDIVCPTLKLALEPGSYRWHYEVNGEIDRNDVLKRELCEKMEYRCIFIYDSWPEDLKKPFEKDCYVYTHDFGQAGKEKFFAFMDSIVNDLLERK